MELIRKLFFTQKTPFTIVDKEGVTVTFEEDSVIGKYSKLYKKNFTLNVPFPAHHWAKHYDYFNMDIKHALDNMTKCTILKEVNITTPELYDMFKSFNPPTFVFVDKTGGLNTELEIVWKWFTKNSCCWDDVYNLKDEFHIIANCLKLDANQEWEKFLSEDPTPYYCRAHLHKNNGRCRSKRRNNDYCSLHKRVIC